MPIQAHLAFFLIKIKTGGLHQTIPCVYFYSTWLFFLAYWLMSKW